MFSIFPILHRGLLKWATLGIDSRMQVQSTDFDSDSDLNSDFDLQFDESSQIQHSNFLTSCRYWKFTKPSAKVVVR